MPIPSLACIERFANAEGLIGVLKPGEETPSDPIAVADVFHTTRALAETPDLDKVVAQIEAAFLAEVETCIAQQTVTSHISITEYLSMWEIRALLDAAPEGSGTQREVLREHAATMKELEGLRWGVQRAQGPSRYICPDRPDGTAYIPISPELALIASIEDGVANEITIRLFNRAARERSIRFVYGHPDDIAAFSRQGEFDMGGARVG